MSKHSPLSTDCIALKVPLNSREHKYNDTKRKIKLIQIKDRTWCCELRLPVQEDDQR